MFNPTGGSVDLSGWVIDAIGLTLPGGTVMLPGDYLVLTESIPLFQAENPGVDRTVLVQYPGGLSGGGELVELTLPGGTVVDSVAYDDVFPWPVQPDGNGPSLSLFDHTSDNSDPVSWGISEFDGGTPGVVNDTVAPPADPVPALVINEIHGSVDFLELVSLEAAPVDLEGFRFSTGITHEFPAGSSIAPGELLVMTDDLAAFALVHPGVAATQWDSGGLSGGGEEVTLVTADGVVVDVVDYSNTPPWPADAGGSGGPSWELIDPVLDNSDGANWEASAIANLDPGRTQRCWVAR